MPQIQTRFDCSKYDLNLSEAKVHRASFDLYDLSVSKVLFCCLLNVTDLSKYNLNFNDAKVL